MPDQSRRAGLKDSSSHINSKANRSRSGSTSTPGSKSSSAKAVQKTELDLLISLKKIEFSFDYEVHSRGLITDKVVKLAEEKLEVWKTQATQKNNEAELDKIKSVDISTKKSAVEFLLENSAHVLVSEFLEVVDGSQQLITDVLNAVNNYTFGDFQAGLWAAKEATAKSDATIAELKQKLADQEAIQKTVAEQKSLLESMKLEIDQLKSKPIINIQPAQDNFQNPINNNNASNNNSNYLQPNQNQPGDTTPGSLWTSQVDNSGQANGGQNNDVFTAIQQLTDNVNRMNGFQQQMVGQIYSNTNNNPSKPIEPEKKPKINGKPPPKFNVNEHRSLRLFSMSEFARWAGDQGLTERWSTLWFCQSFSGKEDLDTVFMLSRDDNGYPRYNKMSELVEQIINDLCVNEETEKELRRIYDNYKWHSKRSVEQNFKWICEQRRLGWPNESATDALVSIKELFEDQIPQGQGLCGTVYNDLKYGVKWEDCTTNYQCQKLLRELQSRYFKDPNSSYYLSNSSKPTNSHSATEKMDISNIEQEVQNIGKDFYKNPDDEARKNTGTKSKFSPQKPQTPRNVNAIEEKECANPKCSTVFKPRFSHFYCCTSKCARDMPQRQRKKELNAIEKALNGVHDDANPDENVSSEFYITPSHVYTPGSPHPFVIQDALFDTGAGPTLVTTATVKLLKMSHLIKSITRTGFSTGDKSPMKGNIGTIELDIGVEDTTRYVTDRVKMTFDVFESLNHKFIIGRNTMLKGIRKFEIYPILKTVLFNPSLKKTASWNKILAKRLKSLGLDNKLVNNVTDSESVQTSESDIWRKPVDPNIKVLFEEEPKSGTADVVADPVPTKSTPSINNFKFKPKYSDSDTVLLNVPCSKFNEANFERYASVLDLACNNFMEVTQQESTLEEILTAGGLDGLIDKNDITSVDTKIINTKKGELKVGSGISDRMEAIFKKIR